MRDETSVKCKQGSGDRKDKPRSRGDTSTDVRTNRYGGRGTWTVCAEAQGLLGGEEGAFPLGAARRPEQKSSLCPSAAGTAGVCRVPG